MKYAKIYLSFASVLGFSSLLSTNAYAIHVDMKPGLWEYTFKMSDTGSSAAQKAQQEQAAKALEEMKKQYANMPPEQRKMIEDVMAKQGIKLGDGNGSNPLQGVNISKDGTSVKACVTQEEIDAGNLPKQDECEHNITQVSANVLKVTYSCKGAHPYNGEGTITFQSPKSYSGNMTVTSEFNNKQQTVQAEQSGKWLSSDCGDVKPMPQKIQ